MISWMSLCSRILKKKIFEHPLPLAYGKASHTASSSPSDSKPKNLEMKCANFIKTKKANCKLICQQFLIKLRKKGNNFQELLMSFEWFSRIFMWKIADSIKKFFYWGKFFESILLSEEFFPFEWNFRYLFERYFMAFSLRLQYHNVRYLN